MDGCRNKGLVGVCALAVLLGVGAPSDVRAQAGPVDAGDAQQAEEARYRNLVREALQEYQLSHWTEARTLLMAAHELNPNARTQRGLGMVAFELRDYADAAQWLEQALSDDRKPLDDEQRQEVQALLNRTERFLGYYKVEAAPPWKSLQITVDGHTARLDETGHIVLEAGEHSLNVSADGAQTRTFALDVRGGERELLQADLQPRVTASSAEASAASSAGAPAEAVRPLRTWGIVVGATGIASLIAGSVVGVLALVGSNEQNQDEGARDLALTADILLGAGALTATAGLSLWLVREDPQESRRTSARLSPSASAHSAGLVLRGGF